MRNLVLTLAIAASLTAVACAGSQSGSDDEPTAAGSDELQAASSAKSFIARGTGYFPDNSAMEGGFVDRKGVKLNTLQQYLAGQAKYVSVAMDPKAFTYGQRLRISELNKKYGKDIVFRVVDTGSAFTGKGTSRIDICTASSKASVDPTINGQLHIDAIADSAPSVSVGSTSAGSTGTADADDDDDSTAHSNTVAGGASCGNDGSCNPGNDGAGLICVSSHCVPGCHSNAQCPGVTSCVAGKCR